jgi:hypothetical protein
MRNSRTITTVTLIAIPLALFSIFHRFSDAARSCTIAATTLLIFFAWHQITRQSLPRFDKFLIRTYLNGLLTFSVWLVLNMVVVDTYDLALAPGYSRDGGIRSFCLTIEPFLVGCGLAIAALFIVLCMIKLFSTIVDHLRRTVSQT